MSVQYKLTGLYQQNLSARHIAEAAIFTAYEGLKQELATTPENVTLEELMESLTGTGSSGVTAGGGLYASQITTTPDGIVTITGIGTSSTGVINNLKAQFRIVKQNINESSSVTAGVIACIIAMLDYNTRIDSWSSGKNRIDYDPTNVRPLGTDKTLIKVIGTGGALGLVGNSTIWGSTFSQHATNVTGSGAIYGNVSSGMSDVTINSAPLLNSSNNLYAPVVAIDDNMSISGDIKTPGSIIYRAGSIGGAIRANRNFTLASGAAGDRMKIHNQGPYQGSEMVLYGGNYIPQFSRYPANLYQYGLSLDNSRFRKDPEIPTVPDAYSYLTNPPPADFQPHLHTDQTCEPIVLTESMAEYTNPDARPIVMDSSGMRWSLTPSSASGVGATIEPQEETLPTGGTVPMFIISRLAVNSDSVIAVSGGNVYLKIDQDMTLTKGATIDIAAGSSLTVYVQGAMTLSDAKTIGLGLVGEGQTAQSALAVYSNNTTPLTISNNTSMYGLFYLPRKTVFLNDNTHIRGSLRANAIYMQGNSKISADEQMGAILDVPTPGEIFTIEFLGFTF